NIDCRYNYTNHFDVFADLAGIYLSQIYYAPEGSAAIAGEISCPWNDRKTPTQDDIIRQNNTWANTIASACRAWTGGGEGYIETQGAVLPNSGPQYDDFADWERRFLHWKDRWLADEPIPYVRQTNVRWRLTDMMANGGNAATVLPPETEGPQTSYTLKGQTVGTRLVTGAAVYLRHTWGATVPCVFGDPATGNTAYAWTYIYSDHEQTAGALIELQNYGRSENDPAPAAGQWDRKGSRIWLNGEELSAPSWKNAGKTIGSEVELQDENFTAREPYPVVLKQGWNLVFLKLPYVSSGCRLNKWMWTFVLTDPDGRHALEGIRYSPDRLSDDAAEQLVLLISDIETTIAATVSDRIGYYKRESAKPLLDLIAAIRPTLSEELPADERAAQQQQLAAAYATFLATYKDAGINLPATSTDGDEHWFTLQSKRASRYATSAGAGAAVCGNTALTTAAYWKFTQRTDGTLNIVSRDGLYLSPASQNNTALTAVRQQPAKGWTLSPSAAEGYVIVTSGSAQINQTNLTNYPLYNWGSGTNTTDEGCQYLIAEAPRLPVESVNYSTDARSYFYHLYTPNRESRYPTAYGDGADIIGQTAPSDAAAWKFVERTDGTVDIVNYTDDTYVSPASAYNTALRTTAAQPSAGWTLKRSGNYFIIYSGSTAQWNQTKSGQNYKLYNWGNQGTPNTSDTGCQYLIVEADVTLPDPQPDALTSIHSTAFNPTYYTLDGRPCPQPRHGLFVERRKGMVRKVVR
ncbi:MAG: hypothetical protein HUK02_07405, partial [Bacteroidaceae bacterium]|nr:hypothetical protein [Bacteroidaceae bacterium]